MHKSYCKKCKSWKEDNQFFQRDDRDCSYSWCISCCEKTPLMITLAVYPSEVVVMDRICRTVDYPEEGGYGKA